MTADPQDAAGPLTYEEALAYLYRLANYEHQRLARYGTEVFDLTRIERLLSALGNPHCSYPSMHIAGTKGKGSVAAMSAAVLRAAGLHTGLYTSPHLHDFRERIQIDARWISKRDLAALVEQVRPGIEANSGVTWFDAVTALPFCISPCDRSALPSSRSAWAAAWIRPTSSRPLSR